MFIGGILMHGGAFVWYLYARFDLVGLLRGMAGDDAFRYCQVVRNLAEGRSSTFDGGFDFRHRGAWRRRRTWKSIQAP